MSKKLKHTPGPWIVLEHLNGIYGRYGVFQHTEEGCVYHIATIEDGGQFFKMRPNAELMAAAPEMYELLRRIVNELQSGDPLFEDCVLAQEVVALLSRMEAS